MDPRHQVLRRKTQMKVDRVRTFSHHTRRHVNVKITFEQYLSERYPLP